MAGETTGPSPLGAALERVGDRWTMLLVEALLDGSHRFGELAAAVPGIAPNVLARRLRHLEGERLVLARRYSERPPRHEYELTAAGRDLAGAIRLLAAWGAGHVADTALPRHDACGSELEPRWWCPLCELAVADGDDADVQLF